MNLPLIATKDTWSYLTFAYIFLAAVLPMWLLMQPRDYMTTFMFAGMIIGAVPVSYTHLGVSSGSASAFSELLATKEEIQAVYQQVISM